MLLPTTLTVYNKDDKLGGFLNKGITKMVSTMRQNCVYNIHTYMLIAQYLGFQYSTYLNSAKHRKDVRN